MRAKKLKRTHHGRGIFGQFPILALVILFEKNFLLCLFLTVHLISKQIGFDFSRKKF